MRTNIALISVVVQIFASDMTYQSPPSVLFTRLTALYLVPLLILEELLLRQCLDDTFCSQRRKTLGIHNGQRMGLERFTSSSTVKRTWSRNGSEPSLNRIVFPGIVIVGGPSVMTVPRLRGFTLADIGGYTNMDVNVRRYQLDPSCTPIAAHFALSCVACPRP